MTIQLPAVQCFWIEEVVESKAFDNAADGEGVNQRCPGARTGELREQLIKFRNRTAKAHHPMQGSQSLAAPWMTDCVKLEFNIEENAFAILA